jgi:translation elongation factor EF-Ts
MCKKEIEAVNKAHIIAEAEKKEKKLQNQGKSSSTGRKLTSGQLNKYLKNFPIRAQDY